MAQQNDPSQVDPTAFNNPGQGQPLPPGFGQPQQETQPNWTEGWRDFDPQAPRPPARTRPTPVDRDAFGNQQGGPNSLPEGFGQKPAPEPNESWTEGWRDFDPQAPRPPARTRQTPVDRAAFGNPQGGPNSLPEGFGQQPAPEPSKSWTEGWRDYQPTGQYDAKETGPFQPDPVAGAMGPELPTPDVTGGVGGQMGPDDPNRQRQDLAGPPTPAESMGPPATDFEMGPPSPSTPATDGAGPQPQSSDDLARERAKDEKDRFNKLMTERARSRRGLPAMFEDARAAIDGGAEAMKKYRQGPGTTGAAAAAQEQPRKYRTGETVKLTGIPGGQESTTVYSMGGGITLPDSQGMTAEDFNAAFQQLNPGKSPVDAIQSLAREPGVQGNAARKLLRDLGATGGVNLSAQQREQLTQQLSGRASTLLRDHAQGMASGIESGSRAIQKEQEELSKQQEKFAEEERGRREKVLDRARKRLDESIKSGNTARSLDSFIEEEYDLMMQEEAFFRGEGAAPQRQTERAPRVDITESVRRPDRVPAGAMPEGGYIREDGLLEYKTEGLPRAVPAILYESDATPAGGIVIPVIDNDDQAKALPAGQSYVTSDGQFKPGRGQSGRPTADGGTAGTTSTRATSKKDESEDIGKRLVDAREDLVKERNEAFENKYKGRVDQIEQIKFKLADVGMVGTARENAIAELQRREAELEELRKAEVQDPTPEEVRERVVGERTALREATKVGEDIRFYEGDPQIFADRTTQSLPEGSQVFVTGGGPVISIGDENIPAKMVGKTAVASPTSVGQIVALERGSRGNTPVASMGSDELGVVGSDSFKRSTELRSSLSSLAEQNPEALVLGFDPSVMEKIDEFITAKYPDLPIEQRPAIAKAVAESVGFRTNALTQEEMQSRREGAGFGEVYDGAARQAESLEDRSPSIAASQYIKNFDQKYGFSRDEMIAEMGAGPYYQMIEKSFMEDARTKALGELERTNPDVPYRQRMEMAAQMAADQLGVFDEAMADSGFDRATMLNMRRSEQEIINLLQGRD